MSRTDHPRQKFSFDSVLTCIGDPGQTDIRVGLHGLEGYEREWQLKELCAKLMAAVKHPTNHLLQLDTHLSGLIPGTLKQSPSVVVSEHTISNKALVSEANRLLSRFPKHLRGYLRCL